jgi:hypothetical protein
MNRTKQFVFAGGLMLLLMTASVAGAAEKPRSAMAFE